MKRAEYDRPHLPQKDFYTVQDMAPASITKSSACRIFTPSGLPSSQEPGGRFAMTEKKRLGSRSRTSRSKATLRS